ncbi:helix-turn-helix domain-containing protein [Devosia sp. YIM 151766]|uniref:helix-turn-helix domain-containing protein n=1 Tax=Devosia sp. YIM 151766 TaxID=3017325 RepID=UPI00255C585E|nr:helix-turn-helix domain-containing protein [Devosia sp. YIM 151766]WIY54133.1 helix-turn-helix domain-containing protein [Devosia sp. YIM 151766]
MSHDATNWAVKQRGLRPIAKVVLWHLADCHNPSMGCFPTQEYLAGAAEVSRASVNRILAELEHAGIIRREQQIDPKTNRQLPTRYLLAFENGFEPLHVDVGVTGLDTAFSDDPCLKNDESRVSKSAVSVSQSCETLTSKGTSNLTGNALRAESERVDFDLAWNAFPHRPMSNRTAAQKAWAALSDEETIRCMTAIKRFARWHVEDSEMRGVDPKAQLEFRPGMGRWIGSGAWIEALTVPLKSDPAPPQTDGLVVLTPDHPDFIAIERLRGRKVPLGQSGRATFRIEEIEQARAAA